MPLPITPTVLTVLTSALTSASRMFPFVSSTIVCLSVIPRTLDHYRRPMRRALENLIHLFGHAVVDHSNSRDQFPRKEVVDQELGLASTFTIHILYRVIPPLGLHNLPIDFVEIGKVLVKRRVCQLCVAF